MKQKSLGLALLLLSAGIGNKALSNDVLIPYIKAGGNWVSLVGYMTRCPAYNTGDCNNPTNALHFVYWYKKDWSGFESIKDYIASTCQEYNVEVPATPADFTTVDVSSANKLSLTDNVLGKPDYDSGSTVPANSDFALNPNSVVDAYLIIQDGNKQKEATTDDVGNKLHVEAIVMDTITGMFFYQFGIDIQGSVDINEDGTIGTTAPDNKFAPSFNYMMFQGEDFATTSAYYIPVNNAARASSELIMGTNGIRNMQGCMNTYYIKVLDPGFEIARELVYNRQEDSKSGLKDVCVTCLGLVPVKTFMSDALWNRVKNSGGWFRFSDTGGVTYKGEVYKISTKPNIFAPFKSYENSLALD